MNLPNSYNSEPSPPQASPAFGPLQSCQNLANSQEERETLSHVGEGSEDGAQHSGIREEVEEAGDEAEGCAEEKIG